MADELDQAGMDFISEKSVNLRSQNRMAVPEHYGGKRHTTIPRGQIQARTGRYISDEPERFEQYIQDIKKDFVYEEQALLLIEAKFNKDSSLKHLIDFFKSEGTIQRELGSIIQLPSVQNSFNYKLIAKRIGMRTKEFEKQKANMNMNELMKLLERLGTARDKKKVKPELDKLFVKQKTGTVKGTNTTGQYTSFKIFSKTIVRYRDAKGHFIKTS